MISKETYHFKNLALDWIEQTWKDIFVQEDGIGNGISFPSMDFLNIIINEFKVKECQEKFLTYIPSLKVTLEKDAQFFLDSDPAAKSIEEVVLTYPGFYAISIYRIAHYFQLLNIPLFPRILAELVQSKTGIDIHPGASIDVPFFIDHGTGIVIGETTIIGKNVKIYQGVTLGAIAVRKNLASMKRHPTVEDDVVLYAGSCVLGGETVIGRGCIIGGNAWITTSIPSKHIVINQSKVEIIDTLKSQQIINFSI